jgi:hypothetical protein
MKTCSRRRAARLAAFAAVSFVAFGFIDHLPGANEDARAACTQMRPENTNPPKLSGTPAVGQTISATTGTWTSCDGQLSFTFTWFRDDGTIVQSGPPNPGFTPRSTYVVGADDAGGIMTVLVEADSINFTVYADSNPLQIAGSGDEMGTQDADQSPDTGDDTVNNYANPTPMSPSGPVTSGYSTEFWPAEASGAQDGLYVISSSAPGTAGLTGIVRDSASGNPIAGASVTMTASGTTTTTTSDSSDSNGAFAFINMPAATYSIVVSAAGLGDYTVVGGSYDADNTYTLTADMTTDPQSFDETAFNPLDTTAGNPAAFPENPGQAYSENHVPPSIRVKMLSTYGPNGPNGTYCQTVDNGTPPDQQPGPVKTYPLTFYVLHTTWGELKNLSFPENAVKAQMALVQNYAWWHKTKGGSWDVYNASNVYAGQCFRPEMRVSVAQWNTWVQDVLPNRIVNSAGHLAHTQYASGKQATGTLTGYCDSPPDYEPIHQTEAGYAGQGPYASQWGLKQHALATPDPNGRTCQLNDWKALSLLYYPTTWANTRGKLPPPPATGYTLAGGNITFTFHSRSTGSVNVAWRYLLQRKTASGWRTLATMKWNSQTQTVAQSYTYTPPNSNCTLYRIKAWNPDGYSLAAHVGTQGKGLKSSGECTP